jgi:hypothetical protein
MLGTIDVERGLLAGSKLVPDAHVVMVDQILVHDPPSFFLIRVQMTKATATQNMLNQNRELMVGAFPSVAARERLLARSVKGRHQG